MRSLTYFSGLVYKMEPWVLKLNLYRITTPKTPTFKLVPKTPIALKLDPCRCPASPVAGNMQTLFTILLGFAWWNASILGYPACTFYIGNYCYPVGRLRCCDTVESGNYVRCDSATPGASYGRWQRGGNCNIDLGYPAWCENILVDGYCVRGLPVLLILIRLANLSPLL